MPPISVDQTPANVLKNAPIKRNTITHTYIHKNILTRFRWSSGLDIIRIIRNTRAAHRLHEPSSVRRPSAATASPQYFARSFHSPVSVHRGFAVGRRLLNRQLYI